MTPDAPPPCTVTYAVHAPGWNRAISEAVGTISLLSGITFRLSDDAMLRFVRDDSLMLGPDPRLGYAAPGVIGLAEPGQFYTFQPKQRRVIVMHELMHEIGIGHNDEPDSIMQPNYAADRLSVNDAARIAAAGAECVR